MKKKLYAIAAIGVLGATVLSSYQTGTHNSLGNRTGSDGSTTGCFNCHGNANNATTASVLLMDGTTPVTSYEPGKTYSLVLVGSNTGNGHPKYGFQLTCADGSGAAAGTLSANGVSGVTTRANNTFLEHTTPQSGTLTNGDYIYGSSFEWTAPAAGTGTVKFYTVINGVNANGASDAGDQWNFGTSASITEETVTAVHTLATLKGVQLYPNPAGTSVTLQVAETTPGAYQLQLMDISGRVCQSEQRLWGTGTNRYTFDLSGQSAGIYLIKVSNGSEEAVLKIHKQ